MRKVAKERAAKKPQTQKQAVKKPGTKKMPPELLERFKSAKKPGEQKVRAAVMPSSKGKRAEKAKALIERGKKRLTKARDLKAAGKTEKAAKVEARGMKAMAKAADKSRPTAKRTAARTARRTARKAK